MTHTVTYRTSGTSDVPGIVECALAAFWPVDGTSAWDRAMGFVNGQDWAFTKRRRLSRFVETHPERCLVAQAGDRIAGFVMWRVDPTDLVGEVANLAVHPDFQGHGIARLLMEHAIETLRSEGMRSIKVFTGLDVNHEAARRLYERLGFRDVWHTVTYGMVLDSD